MYREERLSHRREYDRAWWAWQTAEQREVRLTQCRERDRHLRQCRERDKEYLCIAIDLTDLYHSVTLAANSA